jgi:hypothetical protein
MRSKHTPEAIASFIVLSPEDGVYEDQREDVKFQMKV